ncbi:pilus assembly protein [Roseovarius sp. SCSIO 43702]|uniref:TadE/TadG family type IV pilus assembly protein n=1 Tax=Roseovarius sp. SCSIO 43702 TaxID=2823043 RepID=UPI001C72A0E6|nr:TadE/TadG family type IV pilus assembly protein [Roseovarius sp. SCSIO 43702]QYX58148.1 pilus assembly protein [Roseovarius sp. SCSIO 43702]
MMTGLRTFLTRFRRDEDGNSSVEFMILFPVYFALLIMSLELSMITLRHTMLERGLDIAVRELRLGTGTAPQHSQIKQIICDNALLISDCSNSLKLEMVPKDIRAFVTLDGNVDCSDKAAPSKPVKAFVPGQQNELMMLRACLKYDPIFPKWDLARALDRDSSGQIAIQSTTAFVQEPL